MPLPSPAPLDEGWQVVSPEWWRIPFNAVSWAYSPQDVAATEVTQSPRVAKVAKPPHYHAALFSIRAASTDDQQYGEDFLSEGDDGRLNPDLVGFKGAEAAVESYEIDVGFHWPPMQIEEKRRPDLALEVKEDHVALAKERWDELVQDLTGGLSIANTDRYHDSDDDSMRGLRRSTSTLSSIDLTDSERSVLSVSMPATPRAHRSYANIVVKTTSPSRSTSSRDSDRSPRRLNAGASTFVPNPAKAKTVSDPASFFVAPETISFPSLNVARAPSPSFNANFVFPSLDVPPLPAVKIAKDAQGFYSEVDSTPAPTHARTSSALLPAFLHDAFARRRPPTSKTRAIVDRLKSSGSGGTQGLIKPHSAPPQLELSVLSKPRLSVSEYGSDGDSPALDGDSEGWIGGEDAVATGPANSKSRRTRDLFLALTRRRSNSSPPKPTLVVEPPADEAVGITVELPSPTSSSSHDGWIEGPALLLPESAKPKPAVAQPPERKLAPAVEVKPVVHRQPSPRASKKSKRAGPVPVPVVQPPPPGAFYARPPPPYYYPHSHPHAHPPVPVPYAAAYMHQMQVLHVQQQHQMHMRRGSAPAVPIPVRAPRGSIGSGEWYPYPAPVATYPVPVPALHPAQMFVPRGV
ncbi:hypothetical protein B0H12DRAFT_1229384 [Mycena haematopus]|nr:hypothetical protein B0H12DRAFT_1229384 [Mycena haematopus]